MPSNTMKPFGYFDAAFVVNLDRDIQNMRDTSERLGRLNISFERFSAIVPPASVPKIPGPKGANLIGCTLSHRAILTAAIERGYESILIFEDDVIFRDDSLEIMGMVVQELAQRKWDLLLLGALIVTPGPKVSAHLSEVQLSYLAHAYAIKTQAIPRVIDWMDHCLAIGDNTFDCFADPTLLKLKVTPALAVQSTHHSETDGFIQDRYKQIIPVSELPGYFFRCRDREALITPPAHIKSKLLKSIFIALALAKVMNKIMSMRIRQTVRLRTRLRALYGQKPS